MMLNRQLLAGDPLKGGHHFRHGITAPGTEIEYPVLANSDLLQGSDMRLGKIAYMDVVTDCSSVSSRIIGAEDLRRSGFCSLQQVRDQMSLRIMALTQLSHSTGSVEVTQRNCPEPMSCRRCSQHVIDSQLRSASTTPNGRSSAPGPPKTLMLCWR